MIESKSLLFYFWTILFFINTDEYIFHLLIDFVSPVIEPKPLDSYFS